MFILQIVTGDVSNSPSCSNTVNASCKFELFFMAILLIITNNPI